MDENYQHIYITIGNNIKKARTDNGWSQQELANRCQGTNREKISKMENARVDYMLSTLLDVCNALDMDISTAMKKDEEC